MISCNSYDSGGVVVIVTATDCRVLAASVGGPPSTTTTVAAGRDGVAVTGGSRDLVALRGGFKVVDDGSMTDKVASVFAAMAAGGGTAVTIGPPSTTGEATALVACVVAMAVAEVDAVIGLTGCTVVVVDAANVGAVVNGGKESNAADGDVVDVVVVVIVAVTVAVAATVLTTLSGGGRATSFGGASALDDATAAAVDCFLGKRGDNLTGGRMTVGFAATVGLEPAAMLVDGCDRLGVLGDLSGNGDLGATGLRGVGGNFLRGDDLTAAALLAVGTVGGFPVATGVFRPPVAPLAADGCLMDELDVRLPVADRSLVDADSRFLSAVMAVGRRLSSTIRDSDD